MYPHPRTVYTDHVSNELGTLLHYHRTRLQLSQGEAADRVGATQQSWSRWEAGIVQPPLHRIVAISKAFGADIGDLRSASEHDSEARHLGGVRPTTRVQQLEQHQAELEAELAELRSLVQQMNGATPLASKQSKTGGRQAQGQPQPRRQRRAGQ